MIMIVWRVRKVVSNSHGTYGQTEEDGQNVAECILSDVGQTVGYTGFLEQVAEHQHTDQRSGIRQKQDNDGCDCDREDDLLSLGDRTQLHHLDLAVLLAGERLHNRRLDHRDQCHVRVRRNRDRRQVLSSQTGGNQNRRRTVRTTDDADGSSDGDREARTAAWSRGMR